MKRVGLTVMAFVTLATAASPAAADPYAHGHRWGVGLRSTALAIAPDDDPGRTMTLGGGGWQVRWRLSARWSLELVGEHVQKISSDGAFERHSRPITLSGLWHLTPYRRWDWYLIFGVGGTDDEVRYRRADQASATERFSETHVHMGLGVERFWGRFGVGAELSVVGLVRDDDRGDGPRYAGRPYGPIPMESSGSQFSLTATYYF